MVFCAIHRIIAVPFTHFFIFASESTFLVTCRMWMFCEDQLSLLELYQSRLRNAVGRRGRKAGEGAGDACEHSHIG